MFFTGTTATTGRELWSSDGTVAGTAMVSEITPGVFDGIAASPVKLGDRVVFGGKTPDYQEELFISDGTAAGTQ